MKEPKKETIQEENAVVEAEAEVEQKPDQPKKRRPDLNSPQFMTREELVISLTERTGIAKDRVERFTDVFLAMLTNRSSAALVLSRIASFASPSPYHREETVLFQNRLPLS